MQDSIRFDEVHIRGDKFHFRKVEKVRKVLFSRHRVLMWITTVGLPHMTSTGLQAEDKLLECDRDNGEEKICTFCERPIWTVRFDDLCGGEEGKM